MNVVDASAALAALLHQGPARELLDSGPIHAPHLIDPELVSALRRLVFAKTLPAAHGRRALDSWRRMAVIRHALHPVLGRIWELRDNLSAYDASYVALAETMGAVLVTADARLTRAPGIVCPVTVVPR
jgi:predicted nucleic acid-binding protein